MRTAVVGVGRWGVNHVRVLTQLRDEGLIIGGETIDEVFVVDKDRGRAKEVAERFRADSYSYDLGDLKDVDAFIIAVPTAFHYEVAIKALEKGDVFVEKPLAASIEEGEEIVSLSKKLGRILCVGHIERFNPVISALMKELGSKRDDIIYILGERVGPGPPSSPSNLGVAHDLLIHDVDICLFLLNEVPESVKAIAYRMETYPYEVDITAVYRFPRGIIANLRASWRTNPKLKKRFLEVQTEDKIFTVDYISMVLQVEEGLREHKYCEHFLDTYAAYVSKKRTIHGVFSKYIEPLRLELIDFLESVCRRKKPLVSGEEGLLALKCVIKALESAEKEEAVRIS